MISHVINSLYLSIFEKIYELENYIFIMVKINQFYKMLMMDYNKYLLMNYIHGIYIRYIT